MNTQLDRVICDTLAMHPPYIKIVGGGGTGKTLSLAYVVRELLANGVDARDILVVCPTLSAADAFVKLANKVLAEGEEGEGAEGDSAERAESEGVAAEHSAFAQTLPQVTTAAQYCVEILSTLEAQATTGRVPRVLAAFEERILMEDMKVCGLKPKRLREMLKFFYREMTELGDEKDTFILDSEESDVYETLLANLRLRNAVLPQELSGLAYKYVRDHAEEAAVSTRRFVLVDDFQNLTVAAQLLGEALACEALIITGSLNEQVATMEPYPSPDAFRKFELTHEGVELVRLSQGLRAPNRITAMANSLVVNGGLAKAELVELSHDAPSQVHFVKWPHPNDEFLGIARYIKHRLADTEHPIRASDIFVAVPNGVWGRAIAKVLVANHIKVDAVMSHHAIKGDPRDMEKSKVMQAFTRLNLAAEPGDVAAWRNWCGFGDYLANSNKWFRLEKYCQERNIGVIEALDLAELLTEEELFAGANDLVAKYREGKKFIEKTAGKQGFSLLHLCSPDLVEEPRSEFMTLVEPVEGGETAAELLERARGRMESRFTDTEAVRIGLMEMSCGMSFDTVIFTGCVEGFWPAIETIGVENDDERNTEIRKGERREWYAAMTKARYAFVASTVSKDEANTAQALGMHVQRISMEDGKSVSILAPTSYLEEMGAEAPGFEATI